MTAPGIFPVAAVLAAVLAVSSGCGPKRPDTSIPTIAISFVSVVTTGNSNAMELDATVDDADGPRDITSVTCATTTGGHTGVVTDNMNGIWSCNITLGPGSWSILMTATDAAGWSAVAGDNESF
jgi:hypothetical protein